MIFATFVVSYSGIALYNNYCIITIASNTEEITDNVTLVCTNSF